MNILIIILGILLGAVLITCAVYAEAALFAHDDKKSAFDLLGSGYIPEGIGAGVGILLIGSIQAGRFPLTVILPAFAVPLVITYLTLSGKLKGGTVKADAHHVFLHSKYRTDIAAVRKDLEQWLPSCGHPVYLLKCETADGPGLLIGSDKKIGISYGYEDVILTSSGVYFGNRASLTRGRTIYYASAEMSMKRHIIPSQDLHYAASMLCRELYKGNTSVFAGDDYMDAFKESQSFYRKLSGHLKQKGFCS